MTAPYWTGDGVELYLGDMREVLPALGITCDLIVAGDLREAARDPLKLRKGTRR